MIWIRNGIRATGSMVKGGLMIPSSSRYKRAKPTRTDPEDDRRADPTLPIGSTSKTYDPQKDYTMWQRRDSSQYWKQAASSGDQWRPKLRSETEMSSVAGDTSDASRSSSWSEEHSVSMKETQRRALEVMQSTGGNTVRFVLYYSEQHL